MRAFKILTLFLLQLLTTFVLGGSKCPQDDISKLVVCYYKGEVSLDNFNICNCTHIVFINGTTRFENNNITVTEDTLQFTEKIKERKDDIFILFSLRTKQDEILGILKSKNKSQLLVNGIADFLKNSQFDGVELDFEFETNDGVSKESYSTFIKNLSKELSSNHLRTKREGYDVFEKLQDDITTASYTTQTPKNSTSKTQSIRQRTRKRKENNREVRENKNEDEDEDDYLTLEEVINAKFSDAEKLNTLSDTEKINVNDKKYLIFIRLSVKPEIIAKKYDLKLLSRYADILTVPTHNIVNSNENDLTYHQSRLMGLSDILNTDSILDFLTGMGAQKSKIVITLPAAVLKFQLKDEKQNTPRSPSISKPQVIDQSQLCSLFNKSNWTIEREEDLTAPYAFSGKTWLSFEDEISVNIKGKYILLRELAGGGIYPIDSDLNDGPCSNHTGLGGYLTGVLHKNFEKLERKPRALVLESLQNEIHDIGITKVEAGVQLSEYRIVRVVDHSGAVHVIRKNTKTQFECSRQGYFSHPLGCNKFYRCVKFDQYLDEFTVFEYNCPAGLAFDERWEVCVWPGSLPHGAPCTGSSEIAPVPRSHYRCPNREGYYADPENCRWFFACLDHARDGITPLTAYEFRCPFGLVFSEEKLTCDWPWLVGSCGNRGAAGYLNANSGAYSQGIYSATFINGGNIEASLGQYGNTDEASFIGFGKKFGSALKQINDYNSQNTYQGAQSAGFQYISSQFEDSSNRASFASFPDYEISGGRILNKGGVVLDQNIAGISGASAGNLNSLSTQGIQKQYLGQSEKLGKSLGLLNGNVVQSIDLIHNSPIIKSEANLDIGRTNIFHNIGSQNVYESFASTPKPFSVNVPSVQINEEKTVSEYLEHTKPEQSIPQIIKFTTPTPTPSVNIQLSGSQETGKQFGFSQGFTKSQPTISLPTTPVAETLGSGISHAGVSISTPLVSFSPTPEPIVHKFGQINLKTTEDFGKTASVGAGDIGYSLDSSNGYNTNKNILLSTSLVTPKPEIQSFEYTASGVSTNVAQTSGGAFGITQNNQVSNNIPTLKFHSFGNINSEQNIVSENVGKTAVPFVTPTPFVKTVEVKTGIESDLAHSTIPSSSKLADFVSSSIDQRVSDEIKSTKILGSISTPKTTAGSGFDALSRSQNNEYLKTINVNGFSSQIPLVTHKPYLFDLNSNDVTGKTGATLLYNIPSVTPQPQLNVFKNYVEHSNGGSVTPVYSIPPQKVAVGIQNGLEKTENETFLRGSPQLSFNVPPLVSSSNAYSVDRTDSLLVKQALQNEKQTINIPVVKPGLNSDISVQTGGFSKEINSFKSVSELPVSVTSFPSTDLEHAYKQFSSAKQPKHDFSPVQSFENINASPKTIVHEKTNAFVSKIEQPQTLTEVTVEQQPIISVGTVSSNNIGPSLSTPRPFSFSSDINVQQGPAINTFNSQSTFVPLQSVHVTTSVPVVSITPSTPIQHENNQPLPHFASTTPHTAAFEPKEKISLGNYSPHLQQTVAEVPRTVILNQKPSNFQDLKSLSPVAQVVPFTFGKEKTSEFDGFSKINAYLPPSQQDNKVFGSTFKTSQTLSSQFGTLQDNVLLHEQPKVISQPHAFSNVKTSSQQKLGGFIQYQSPIQVSTVTPDIQHQQNIVQGVGLISTTSAPFTPQEQLVDLEITKSLEVNPSDFFKTTNVAPNAPAESVVVQQQPINLIAQKSFSTKQVIQPFSETETFQKQINTVFENKYQEQPQVNIQTTKANVFEQKQYLTTAVTPKPLIYSTVKSNDIEQPSVYINEQKTFTKLPTFGISETVSTEPEYRPISNLKINENQPSVEFISKPGSTITVKPNYPQEIVPPKVNFFLPSVSTESPSYSTNAEELTIQRHTNFDFQKTSSHGSTPIQNVFIQSTPKPVLNSFENILNSQVQNPDVGRGFFDYKIKPRINPNIAIPEPPREYILVQNGYTTAAPDYSTSGTVGQFYSTTTEQSVNSDFKGSTYLPPQASSRGNSLKTTLSVGQLDGTQLRDDSVQELIDKYSLGFGLVTNRKTGNFRTKVVEGKGQGEIEVNGGGSSTIQYEVSGLKSGQRNRGRQYHGGLTSGIQATNKYEEYNLNENGQRSFGSEDDNEGVSKTSIDLKNLQLDKNKKTVIVVSQVSDTNPILVGKLAGQCSCQSNKLELRTKDKSKSSRRKNKNPQGQQHSIISNEYLPPFENSQSKFDVESFSQGEASSAAPETIIIGSGQSSNQKISYSAEQGTFSSTTPQPDAVSSTLLSSLGPDGVLSITPKSLFLEDRTRNKKKQSRGRTRYLPPTPLLPEDSFTVPILSPVPASEIASTLDYSVLKGKNNIVGEGGAGDSKSLAGAAFDRYGPGGWRGFDETLQGSVDCKRPGLFRHPKYCNKFYACNYDPWKERFTLHVFNCPIHLTYDSSISACNWPVRGPACADDNLLV